MGKHLGLVAKLCSPTSSLGNQRRHQGWGGGIRAVLVGALTLGCVALAVSTVVHPSDQTRRIEDLSIRVFKHGPSAYGARSDGESCGLDVIDKLAKAGVCTVNCVVDHIARAPVVAVHLLTQKTDPSGSDCCPSQDALCISGRCADTPEGERCAPKLKTWEECPSRDDDECESGMCGYYSPDKKCRCCDKSYGMHTKWLSWTNPAADVCNEKRGAGETCDADDDLCASRQCFRTTRNGSYKCCGRGTFFCYPWTSGNCKSGRTYCKGYLGH